ncbi:hypothetical protein MHI24_07135 [Paenibacillus sp. FSL K6-1096]|uniref:hypothetical protein n=1 Tax=Paenibacillus sp. FSL K6-1096 TaxID=2921460 RepID=UPI0030ED48EC
MLKRERLIKAIMMAAALEEEAVSALIAAEIRKLEYMVDGDDGWEEELDPVRLDALQEAVARVIVALAQHQAMICRTLEISRRLAREVNGYEG